MARENRDNRPGEDLSDHDLLIRIDVRTDKTETCLRNHLRHHWAVEVGLILCLAGALIGLAVKMLVGS